ncbi:MAG: hypothetical protein WBD57_12050, partial [Candidatus Cybelea sp.]
MGEIVGGVSASAAAIIKTSTAQRDAPGVDVVRNYGVSGARSAPMISAVFRPGATAVANARPRLNAAGEAPSTMLLRLTRASTNGGTFHPAPRSA